MSLAVYKTLLMPEKLLAPGDKLCCDCWISIRKQFEVSSRPDDSIGISSEDVVL